MLLSHTCGVAVTIELIARGIGIGGLALDPAAGAAFVACDGNATMLSVDIGTGEITEDD